MKSKEYWEGRFIDLQRSQLKRADSFAHELEDLHQRMQKEIDDDITVWHKKVATANGISMADAKKLMSRKDRKEFQWTLEEYEQHAKADLLSGVTSANVMNASANWHLSYLDGMKLQLEHHVDKLYKNIDSKTRNHFKESLNENYLNTAFELQKGIGIGEKMEVPYDERKLENILRTPWASDGKNFSSRIWRDRTQLVNNLQKNLSESVIRGDSDTDMIQALSKDEKRAEFNTRRLIETESAYFDSLSEQECCEDFGVEKYRYLAVLDMKTSDICQELDNKVFLEKDRQVGVNAPPMHPFCRSTTAPVIDEEFLTSRRAKNPKTGEYDEIPPEMNYKQWKEKYVEGKENAEEEKESVKVDTPNGYEFETKPLEQKALEGETVYKETTLPPKEEKFDSEAYENRVKKQAEKREEQIKPATIELDNPVSYGNTEKVYTETAIPERVQERANNIVEHLENVNQGKENLNIDYLKDFNNLNKDKNFLEKVIDLGDSIQKGFIEDRLTHSDFGNIRHVLLENTSLKFAKDLEYSLKNIKSVMPETLQQVRGTGDLNALINELANNDLKDDIEDYKNEFGINPSKNWITQKIENNKNYYIEKFDITNFTLGIHLPQYKNEKYYGIYIYSHKMEEYEKEGFSSMQLAKGGYTVKGAINHEIGHIIDKLLEISSLNEIAELFQKTSGKSFEEGFISEYAYKVDLKEFVAEAVCEGLTNYDVEILFNKEKLENSNVRYPIKNIFNIIIDEYEKYKKNKRNI